MKSYIKDFCIGVIGGFIITAASAVPIYNYYILPDIRHKEMMDKMDGIRKIVSVYKKST